MLDRPAMKRNARTLMAENTPALYVVSVVYMALSSIIMFFLPRLTGIQSEVSRYQEELLHFYANPTTTTVLDITPIQINIPPVGGALAIILFLFNIVIAAGFLGYCLKISRNESVELSNLFDGFTFFLKVIWLNALMAVFTFLWSLLLVIPGIIARIRYSQALFILFESPEKGALQCIRESKQLMSGRKADYFALSLSFIGWSLLSDFIQMFLFVPVLLIWLNPYVTITKAIFYNRIRGYTQEELKLSEL